jgi:nitrate/TMAO reductase-like tetraheme cytochrome c subunit
MLPDLTFSNSENEPTSGTSPRVTMTLYGLYNSGSGSVVNASGLVAKSSTYVITEEFTGQIFTRLRGRQMIYKIASNQINTCWQLGAPRIDLKPDGRR